MVAVLWNDPQGRKALASYNVVVALSDLGVDPSQPIEDQRAKAVLDLNSAVLRKAAREINPGLAGMDLASQALAIAYHLHADESQPKLAVPAYEVALATQRLSGDAAKFGVANYAKALLVEESYSKALAVIDRSFDELVSDARLKSSTLNDFGVAHEGVGNFDQAKAYYGWAAGFGSHVAQQNLDRLTGQ